MVESRIGDMRRSGLLLAMSALALSPVAAPILTASHPLAAILLRGFFARLCHQDPSRSFLLAGSPIAVCVRCLGIYGGVAISPILHIRRAIGPRLLAFALLLNALDVATEILHWHGNLPLPRFVLGLFLGCATGLILYPARRASLRSTYSSPEGLNRPHE